MSRRRTEAPIPVLPRFLPTRGDSPLIAVLRLAENRAAIAIIDEDTGSEFRATPYGLLEVTSGSFASFPKPVAWVKVRTEAPHEQ